MKKISLALPFLGFAAIALFAMSVSAEIHPSGKTVQGILRTDNPLTVADGENYFFELSNAPLNSQVKLWVDNGDGKGFRDFGILGTAQQSNTAYAAVGALNVSKTLNCSSYEYLEPGKSLSVGNRDLLVKFYVEYVGYSTVSNVSWMIVDCSQTGDPVSTGNPIFPYTLESIYGRNNIIKPFPDSYPSGIPASLKFAGRYFDGRERGGSNTSMGFEWFTIFASNVVGHNPVKVSDNKVYALLGSTLAAYDKNTLLSRLANKTNNSLAVFAGSRENNSGETLKDKFDHAILPWDAYIYPEHKDNAWLREACDCHTGLIWFDVDDRGYVYFDDRFGFGIARDEGDDLRIFLQIRSVEGLSFDGKPIPYGLRTGRNGIVKLMDLNGLGQPNTSDSDRVNIIKNDNKYYAVFTGPSSGGDGGTRILDVTDPNNPTYVRSSPTQHISEIAQAGNSIIALVVTKGTGSLGSGEVRIYNTADFINGTAPKKTFSAGETGNLLWEVPNYRGLTVDKATGRAYSVHYTSHPEPGSSIPNYTLPKASLSVFSPSGNSYTEQKYEITSFGGKGTTSGWAGYEYIFGVKGLSYQNGYLIARGSRRGDYSDVKIWKLANGAPQNVETNNFIYDYYKGTGEIYQATLQTLGSKTYLFVSTYWLADVYELTGATGTTPPPPGSEVCGNNIDDDGDGQTDEGCSGTPLPPPPPPSASCTATLSFDKTSVSYGGSMTESWTVVGADVGQVYGDCGQGATPISAGPQSYTFNNLTKTMTCRVYGKIGGEEKCSASATVTVGAPPSGGGGGGGSDVPLAADNSQGTAFQYYYGSESSPAGAGTVGGTTTLRQGSSGADVATLQALLNQKTDAGLATDGKFGPKTKAAVMDYQRKNGLVADGVVGPKTRAALEI